MTSRASCRRHPHCGRASLRLARRKPSESEPKESTANGKKETPHQPRLQCFHRLARNRHQARRRRMQNPPQLAMDRQGSAEITMFHVPEKFRIKTGPMASSKANGNNGAFIIVSLKLKNRLHAIASDGIGWEHVSVSLPHRCPTWDEMCFVKSLFWDAEDVVMQLHPAESQYVNNHPFCLHLWRPIGLTIPTPESIMVGFK